MLRHCMFALVSRAEIIKEGWLASCTGRPTATPIALLGRLCCVGRYVGRQRRPQRHMVSQSVEARMYAKTLLMMELRSTRWLVLPGCCLYHCALTSSTRSSSVGLPQANACTLSSSMLHASLTADSAIVRCVVARVARIAFGGALRVPTRSARRRAMLRRSLGVAAGGQKKPRRA